MKKYFKIIFEYLSIFLISFILIDFVTSNTFLNLKNKSCSHIEKFYIELKKNCVGKEKIRAYLPTINIYTDKDGLRITKNHKRSENKKVYIYGSSFIYGAGVEYEKSVVGFLESKHKNFEFYNFSMPYGSPTFHLYKLKQKIIKNEIPKKIILVLSLSDILNETSIWGDYDNEKPVLINDDIFIQNQSNEKFHKRNFKLSRSLILNLRNKLRSVKNEEKENKKKVRTTVQAGFTYMPLINLKNNYTDETFNLGKNKIKERINQMINLSKKYKIEFYLAIFPFADTLEYGQSYFDWEKYSKELCPRISCKFVNSFFDYKQYKNIDDSWYEKLFFVGDEHFTELGHLILAERFTSEIF